MIRSSHTALFKPNGGQPPAILEVWAAKDGWKGGLKGNSETSTDLNFRVVPRLQKCALTLLNM